MQTVLFLMLNRYRLVRGKPEFSICAAHTVLVALWLNSSLQAVLWHCLTPGAALSYLNTRIAGVILNNLLELSLALPLPIVVVLLFLIARKARQHIARIAEEQYDISRQMEANLKLLYVFGAVYVLGFGFTCANSFNNLINLCGYVNLVPHWAANSTYCQYLYFFDALCNAVINLANSLIIIQSRYVRVSLRRMYRATHGVVINLTRRGRDRETLVRKTSPD